MLRWLAASIALALCAVGCGDDHGYSVVRSGDYIFPGETLEDWVSYGDQLSVISVVDDTDPEPWPAYRNSGGLAGREVTVRVERTLWRRSQARAAGSTLRFGVWGWMWDDDQDPHSERRPLVSEGAPRMEVGRRYLTMLVRSRGEWFPLTDRAVLTVAPDGVVTSEVISGEPSPAARQLRGKTITQAARAVASTPPDPVAARYFELPPRKRFRAVMEERG
jgi:hypothetical protein